MPPLWSLLFAFACHWTLRQSVHDRLYKRRVFFSNIAGIAGHSCAKRGGEARRVPWRWALAQREQSACHLSRIAALPERYYGVPREKLIEWNFAGSRSR